MNSENQNQNISVRDQPHKKKDFVNIDLLPPSEIFINEEGGQSKNNSVSYSQNNYSNNKLNFIKVKDTKNGKIIKRT